MNILRPALATEIREREKDPDNLESITYLINGGNNVSKNKIAAIWILKNEEELKNIDLQRNVE